MGLPAAAVRRRRFRPTLVEMVLLLLLLLILGLANPAIAHGSSGGRLRDSLALKKPRHLDEDLGTSIVGHGDSGAQHSVDAPPQKDAISTHAHLGWKRVPLALKTFSDKKMRQHERLPSFPLDVQIHKEEALKEEEEDFENHGDEMPKESQRRHDDNDQEEEEEEEEEGEDEGFFRQDMLFRTHSRNNNKKKKKKKIKQQLQEQGASPRSARMQPAGVLRRINDNDASFDATSLQDHRGLIRFELNGKFNYTDADPVFYGTSFEYTFLPSSSIDGTTQLSDFDTTLTVLGVTSVAFAMPPFRITDTSVLEFDFWAVTAGTRFHLCLAKFHNEAYQWTRHNCFLVFADSKARADTYGGFIVGEPWTVPVGQKVPFKVPIGHYMHERVRWMGFRSGSRPASSTEQARAEISAIRLYNEENPLRLQVTAGGLQGGNVDTVLHPVPPRQVVTLSGPPKSYGNAYAYKRFGWRTRDYRLTDQYTISEDQTSIRLNGNVWKAWRFEYPLTQDTVLEFDFRIDEISKFHLICLDELRRDSYYSPYVSDPLKAFGRVSRRCFHLARRDPDSIGHQWSFVSSPQSSASAVETTSWGENRTVVSQHFDISVGHFLPSRVVKWMAFVQNTEAKLGGLSRKVGQTTYSNIRIYERPMRFHLTLNGTTVVAQAPPTSFMPFDTHKRHDQYLIRGEDPSTIQLMGNAWKSFPLNEYAIQGNTMMEFDFALLREAAAHAICVGELRYDLDSCFFLGGTEEDTGARRRIKWTHRLQVREEDDVVTMPPMNGLTGVLGDAPDDGLFPGGYSYRIELGRYLSFRYGANYVAMVSSDPHKFPDKASSIFRNIRIYEEEAFPRLSVTVKGEKVVAGLPVSYIYVEDKLSGGLPKYSISQDGMAVTLHGNSWRAFPLEYEMTSQTVLEMDVTIRVEAEDHAICLAEKLGGFAPLHCIKIAGAAPPYIPQDNDDDDKDSTLLDTVNLNVTVSDVVVDDDDDEDDGNSTAMVDKGQFGIAWRHVIETPVIASSSDDEGPTRVVIHVGAILGTRHVKYLALVSDADEDPSRGESSFGNIVLYENEDLPWIPDTRETEDNVVPTPSNDNGGGGREVKVGALAGIIVAAVALIVMIVAVAALCLAATRKNSLQEGVP